MKILDSHTEGEPTRAIFEAGFDLGFGSLSEKAKVFENIFLGVRKFVNEVVDVE